MPINSIRRHMDLSKHQEYGMSALGTFLLKMILRLVKPTLFTKKWVKIYLYGKYTLMILFFVPLTNHFVISLARSWPIGLRCLWWEFSHSSANEGTFISQTKYTRDILKKFGMDNANPIKILMEINGHLDIDLGGTSVDQKVYHSMIRSLLYLYTSRSDIMLSVCMCTRFQVTPKNCHLRAVKRIMSYLVLTPNLGLWYPKGSHFELIVYSDADYDRCKVDRKNISRTCQFLRWSLIS
jgi:hypothetical protein